MRPHLPRSSSACGTALSRALFGSYQILVSAYATLSMLFLFYGKPVSDVGYEIAARSRLRAYLANVGGTDFAGREASDSSPIPLKNSVRAIYDAFNSSGPARKEVYDCLLSLSTPTLNLT
eukprot:1042873-Amphidinium_carterae.1